MEGFQFFLTLRAPVVSQHDVCVSITISFLMISCFHQVSRRVETDGVIGGNGPALVCQCRVVMSSGLLLNGNRLSLHYLNDDSFWDNLTISFIALVRLAPCFIFPCWSTFCAKSSKLKRELLDWVFSENMCCSFDCFLSVTEIRKSNQTLTLAFQNYINV